MSSPSDIEFNMTHEEFLEYKKYVKRSCSFTIFYIYLFFSICLSGYISVKNIKIYQNNQDISSAYTYATKQVYNDFQSKLNENQISVVYVNFEKYNNFF